MIENEFESPISSDEQVPLKDLNEEEVLPEIREKRTAKKHNIKYYMVLGFLMMLLVFFGLFFGIYLSKINKEPEVEEVIAIPTIIEEQKQASPASTLEVIKKRSQTFDQKLKNTDLRLDDILLPNLDYNLSVQLEGVQD